MVYAPLEAGLVECYILLLGTIVILSLSTSSWCQIHGGDIVSNEIAITCMYL